jgi:P-type E1-E2 ATPase
MISLETFGAFDPSVNPFDEVEVWVENVRKVDFLKIIRGASISVDGKIMHGEIAVDESPITGESLPVLKGLGWGMLGGTVWAEGLTFMKVTRAGSDTTLRK